LGSPESKARHETANAANTASTKAVGPVVADVRPGRTNSLRTIAAELNGRSMVTGRGGR
jgi:hypothetical protein